MIAKTQKYYNKNVPNFKWSSLSYGKLQPKNKYFSKIIALYYQKILNIIFNDEFICKNIL